MVKRKQHFYKLSNTSDLLLTPEADFSMTQKGKRKEIFGYKKIVLELACGKGEYTVGLAKHFPDTLFIGIDIKGDRIARGIAAANENKLSNVRFIRGIIHHLDRRFAQGEIDEIRIVHPDPRPKDKDAKRRLTSPRFLQMYNSLLVPHGYVRLKTDDQDLFEYSLDILQIEGRKKLAETNDLHSSQLLSDHFSIATDYEKLALEKGRTICYGVREKI